jgi:hypothetical protein
MTAEDLFTGMLSDLDPDAAEANPDTGSREHLRLIGLLQVACDQTSDEDLLRAFRERIRASQHPSSLASDRRKRFPPRPWYYQGHLRWLAAAGLLALIGVAWVWVHDAPGVKAEVISQHHREMWSNDQDAPTWRHDQNSLYALFPDSRVAHLSQNTWRVEQGGFQILSGNDNSIVHTVHIPGAEVRFNHVGVIRGIGPQSSSVWLVESFGAAEIRLSEGRIIPLTENQSLSLDSTGRYQVYGSQEAFAPHKQQLLQLGQWQNEQNSWDSAVDPVPHYDLQAVSWSEPSGLFTLRGDEEIRFEYRTKGSPEWFGLYLALADASERHEHALEWDAGPSKRWHSVNLPVTHLVHKASAVPNLKHGDRVKYLKIQAGPQRKGSFEIRNLTIIRPRLSLDRPRPQKDHSQ